jgi:hypothetical protein
MFLAALFTIAKLWKQPGCPITEEWTKKMWYLYTMEFYSATKNEILSFANTWVELENIILSEVTQAQKAKNHMFSLISRLQTYRPKQMQILLGMESHTKGRTRTGGIRTVTEPKT